MFSLSEKGDLKAACYHFLAGFTVAAGFFLGWLLAQVKRKLSVWTV
jgi:hypothetical protein